MIRYRLSEAECEVLVHRYETAETWHYARSNGSYASFFKWCNNELPGMSKIYGTVHGKKGNNRPRLYLRVEDAIELMQLKLTWLSH